MEVGVLGTTEVRGPTGAVELGTPKQRALLTALALYVGRPLPADVLVDLVWGEAAPPGVSATLQAYVSGLRKVLEPQRQRRAPADVLVTAGGGYALRLPPDQLDAVRFSRRVVDVHNRMTPFAGLLAGPDGPRLDPEAAAAVVAEVDEALRLWRGEAYADLHDAEDARAERSRLAELRLMAYEDRALANLALGQHATVAAEAESLTSSYPLRERFWGLRALALARGGRQAEALAVLAEVRTLLDDELGIEPGAELRSLQTAVLRQDSALDAGPPPRRPRSPERPAPAPGPATGPVDRWPMVGRDSELALLAHRLAEAAAGRTVFASLVGEPGIGKSRLAAELMVRAGERGFRVLTGRCSADVGAPPLRPWASVLRGLGADLPVPDAETPDFLVWEQILATVTAAATEQPVLVVLDDLHWADPATLRLLRLLGEDQHETRLMVLLTWRAHPPPSGALGDLAETLARRHATRRNLVGLTSDEAAEVVSAVVGTAPSGGEADTLRRRTDGNPFYLVEYAQLAQESGELARLLAEPDPPTAVHDVLVRRLGRLPDPTQRLLRTAAVVGRSFELDVLAAAAGLDPDDVLDQLEPALEAGLLREDGVDQFGFAHALVRDTAYAAAPVSRRARSHARVATVLEGRAGRELEVARHWAAAGTEHAGRAWRAAVAAAASARQVHAHEQASDLLGQALRLMDGDRELDPRDRYDVLQQLVDTYRWAAQWGPLRATVDLAIEVARELDDVELIAQAAIGTAMGAIWQSYGHAHGLVVGALRECLDRLPTVDGSLRARVMLSLAIELYYGVTFQERLALVDEALAMTARLGDEPLLLDGSLLAISALWCSSTADRRLRHAQESIELARRLGQPQAHVLALTFRAVVECELGDVEAMWSSVAQAREEAERLRLPYSLIVLDTLVLPFLAMAGRFDEAEAMLEAIARHDQQMSAVPSGDAAAGARVVLRQWQGRWDEVTPMLAQIAQGPLPVGVTVISSLLRAGRREEAEAYLREHGIGLQGDDWLSLFTWCSAVEVAFAFHDVTLAAEMYARIAPYAGRVCLAGSGNAMGPVDTHLALAAQTVGETGSATRHADRAVELMEQWQIPLAADWLRGLREEFHF